MRFCDPAIASHGGVKPLITFYDGGAVTTVLTSNVVAAGPLPSNAGVAIATSSPDASQPAPAPDAEVAHDEEVAAGALFDDARSTAESDDVTTQSITDAVHDRPDASPTTHDHDYAFGAQVDEAPSLDEVRDATKDFEDLLDDGASIYSTSSVDSADSSTSYSSSITSLEYASTVAGPAAASPAAQIAAASPTAQIASASTASLASTVSAASTSSSASAASTSSNASAVSTPATSPSLSIQALESEDECWVDEFGLLHGPVQDSLRNRRVRRA